MELHILEHRLQVASVAKESIPLFTYGLIKLAFLSSKTRLLGCSVGYGGLKSSPPRAVAPSIGQLTRVLAEIPPRDSCPSFELLRHEPRNRCKFFSLTETPEDYTIIVDEEGFLELPSSEHLSVADATWLALNVVSGGGSFSSSQPIGVTKIAKSVIAPLADQNISVFMLSTYQTDFILVRERDLPFVTHTLSSEFTILRVVNGETVAAENLGITNGFVKPKMVQRPVIHPLSSPSNRFCVTSLDPDTLPAVATLLMDVMFYSNGVKDPMAAGDDCGHIRFFSFSLIEGYISLVMDVQTQQRFPSNLLFTSASGELWKMVRIGGQPLGFDECGIVAQISEPLAAADIPAYYISTFKFDHALVPEENISAVISALKVSQAEKH
ncbi:cytosolic arginine sensor for mTORC1 subunit 2 isoform X1 [Zalophus californianus]|uniref:Cytosolic arginine sensor for mTORC1 subunit 2 isoform X1 n=1 Tax=Zalophus californianus TaxID=9704 RepID=A0A6J2EHD9_ZALCA|nr:cytosolic arginine sensor for mTORC1 subunit 2 isoform X1 [Zalophus californianus]